jgi:rare lipoprotein A
VIVRKVVSSIFAACVFLFAADAAFATQAVTKPVGQAAAKTAKKTFKLPKLPPPSLTGIASVYRYKKPRRGASGEILNFKTLIAAHRTFRFGTRVKVTNRKNGRSVVVRIIDRGPYIRGRVIDLSPAAAREIGLGWGLAPVTLAVVSGKRA